MNQQSTTVNSFSNCNQTNARFFAGSSTGLAKT